MKKRLYSILLFAGLCIVFAACSSGAYNASPDSPVNGIVNPLKPLTSAQFTWTGTDPMSATINGAGWVASSANWSYTASTGSTVVGYVGSAVMSLDLVNVYQGNVYPMNYNDYNQYATWSDSVGSNYFTYASVLGNSGEVYILENDSARIKGLFYFEALTSTGQVVAINNGYFNLPKF